MLVYESVHEAITYAQAVEDIEMLDCIVDALAAQALGRSALLLESLTNECESLQSLDQGA